MSNLINLSEGASLALHSLALIAEKNPERLNVKYLASFLKSSEAHLAKIVQQLSKSGLLKSLRGPNGGFVLNKPAQKITLLEIFEIIEGKSDIKTCPLGKKHCPIANCSLGVKLNSISKEIYNLYKNMKLSDIIEKED